VVEETRISIFSRAIRVESVGLTWNEVKWGVKRFYISARFRMRSTGSWDARAAMLHRAGYSTLSDRIRRSRIRLGTRRGK